MGAVEVVGPGEGERVNLDGLTIEYKVTAEATNGAFSIGEQVIRAGAGSYVVKPRDVPHAMWNDGDVPSRVAEIVAPAGFEAYFRDLAPILAGEGDTATYEALAERYGVRVLSDWTDELEATYGVKL